MNAQLKRKGTEAGNNGNVSKGKVASKGSSPSVAQEQKGMLQSSTLGHRRRKYNQRQVIDSLAAAFMGAIPLLHATARCSISTCSKYG